MYVIVMYYIRLLQTYRTYKRILSENIGEMEKNWLYWRKKNKV